MERSTQPTQPLNDEWKTCQLLNEFVMLSDNKSDNSHHFSEKDTENP